MSKKYKFKDNEKLYFITFTVVNWIDLFTRNKYKDIFLDAVRFCQRNKDLQVFAWVIMTNHVHMIVGTRGNPLSNIMRDLKRHTSEQLHRAIASNDKESRREWLLWMMNPAGNKNGLKFQLWQPESNPMELSSMPIAHQKLRYLHQNPVKAGFVSKEEDWTYSSAGDYYGNKGLLDIIQLETITAGTIRV
jgi:REP element-mobilizing transposase RayT